MLLGAGTAYSLLLTLKKQQRCVRTLFGFHVVNPMGIFPAPKTAYVYEGAFLVEKLAHLQTIRVHDRARYLICHTTVNEKRCVISQLTGGNEARHAEIA